MAVITKTLNQTVQALVNVSASSVQKSSEIDVSTKLAGMLHIHFGRNAETAAGAGVNIRIEVSSKSSGDGHWHPYRTFTTQFAACSSEAVSGAEAAGETVIGVANTTGLVAGDVVYFKNGTLANSEWHRIKSIVTNTSVTLEDAIVNAQTGATIYDLAEMFLCPLDLSAISRIRIVFDGSVFTQAFYVEAFLVTADSIG